MRAIFATLRLQVPTAMFESIEDPGGIQETMPYSTPSAPDRVADHPRGSGRDQSQENHYSPGYGSEHHRLGDWSCRTAPKVKEVR
jgi:hypothetical protein